MKTRTVNTSRLAAALVLFAALFCAASPARSESKPKYKIKIGSYVTPQSVWGKTVQKTIDSISKRTNGDVQLIHLHSGMLGSAQNMLEQVMLGGIQGAGIPSSNLANLVPEAHIIELPFLFRDRAEAYHLLDKVIAPMLQPKLEAKGLKTSAFMEAGFMDIVSNRFIKKPAELKKVKIGSWESPVHVSFWKAQGANPNPIPATEVFRAYTSGQVDTGANGPNALMAWDSLFGTAIDRKKIFVTNIDFSYQSGVMVINKKYWDSLPANYRKIIQEELDALTGKIRDGLTKAEPKSIKTLDARGYNFYTLSAAEKKAFVTNSAKVYKEFEGIVGKKFLDKVLAERAKYRKTHKK